MIRFAIIDDEPIAHRIIEGYAENLPELKKNGNCYNAFEAIELLQNYPTDLIFLDINMPKLSGFELLKTLSNPPKVIVTSAYKEFAIEGYEFDVIDYLLKPFSLERFLRAVNKLQSTGTASAILQNSIQEQSDRIFIKGDKKLHQVLINDILFVEAQGNYCKVVLMNKTILTLQKISDFEKLLPQNFIRIHKSFIVSKNNIQTIEGNTICLEKHKLPIGQTYRGIIKSLFS